MIKFMKSKLLQGKEAATCVDTEKVGVLIDINAPEEKFRDYWFIETSNLKHAVERYCIITGETAFQFREISEEMFYFSSSYSEGVVEKSTFGNFASKGEEILQYEDFNDIYHIF